MTEKNLPKVQLFNLAFLFFGISFAFTFLTANMSSIFKFLGASNAHLPYLWLAAPVTGLIIQPFVGQLSDDTVSKFGKRRPYLLFWGLLASLAFCILPLFNVLSVTVLFIWIIGFSINGCMEAMRALIGDVVTPLYRARVFALQAILGGIGAAVGASLPFLIDQLYGHLHLQIVLLPRQLPLNLKIPFVLSGIVLLATLAWTLYAVKEKPSRYVALLKTSKCKLSLQTRVSELFHEFYLTSRSLPKNFVTLCLVQFLLWAGVFTFWLYFTNTIAQNLYGLPLAADLLDKPSYAKILEKAMVAASLYSSIYQYLSVLCAALLFFLPKTAPLKIIYMGILLLGSAGIWMLGLAQYTWMLMFGIIAVGIMWGAVCTLPYIIAIQMIPKGKMGTYLGILNIGITLPQVLCGLFCGPVYRYIFNYQAADMLILSGGLVLLGALLLGRQARLEAVLRL